MLQPLCNTFNSYANSTSTPIGVEGEGGGESRNGGQRVCLN